MKLKNIKPALIIFTLLVIGSFSFFAMAEEGLIQGRSIFSDFDKDGLSDDEERAYGTNPNNPDTDGDGYSDGVEVKSGYDPLKAAPGDRIIPVGDSIEPAVLGESAVDGQIVGVSDGDSVTNQLSGKLVEFIKENEGKTGDVSVDDLDAIIQEAIGDELTEESLPEIEESSIKIKQQDYSGLSDEERKKKEKEDAMNYLTSALYIMVSNAPTKISSDDDVASFTDQILGQASSLLKGSAGSMNFFNDLADRGQLIIDQMGEIEVPEKLVPIHKKGLQLAEYSINLKNDININLNDPMGLVVNLSKVQKVVEQGSAFYLDVLAEFKKYGISNETDTPDASVDTAAPVISEFNTKNITSTEVTIAWKTSEVATSRVEYGLTSNYGAMTVLESDLKTEHSIVLSGLTAGTLYHFRVLSADGAGNLATGIDNIITTVTAAI